MSNGINFFTEECFKEASEFFIEVVRLVCEVNFVREAHVYQAKCHVKLVSFKVAIYECSVYKLLTYGCNMIFELL